MKVSGFSARQLRRAAVITVSMASVACAGDQHPVNPPGPHENPPGPHADGDHGNHGDETDTPIATNPPGPDGSGSGAGAQPLPEEGPPANPPAPEPEPEPEPD